MAKGKDIKGVIKGLDAYKHYETVNVTGKDGVTRPVTRVKYEKRCPDCSGIMLLDYHRPGRNVPAKDGFISVGRIVRWKCEHCDYSEREETQREKLIRKGYFDEDSTPIEDEEDL